MNIWRPEQKIVVKSLGLHWRNKRLLAFEVLDDQGKVKGVRPLGGAVEFGETWKQALIREFAEELNIAVTVSDSPLVMESLYAHEGTTGHEILFIAQVTFPPGSYQNVEEIQFSEDNGTSHTAHWFDLDELGDRGIRLFPHGLKDRLVQQFQ